MNTEIITAENLTAGETGTIVSGKFAGREFRVRRISATGRSIMVDWFGSDDTSRIRPATKVEVNADVQRTLRTVNADENVAVVQEARMTVTEAREAIRSMTRGNYDCALAERACAALSDFDPVFSECTR